MRIEQSVKLSGDRILFSSPNNIFTPKKTVMTDIKEQVSQRIKEARKIKGLTQKEIGERMGVS